MHLEAYQDPAFFIDERANDIGANRRALHDNFFMANDTIGLADGRRPLSGLTLRHQFRITEVRRIVLGNVAQARSLHIFRPLRETSSLRLRVRQRTNKSAIQVGFVENRSFQFGRSLVLVSINRTRSFIFSQQTMT